MSRTALAAWLCLGVIWGSNFIFMKWAAEVITPLQIVLVRVAFGFIPVALFALIRGRLRFAHVKHAAHFFAMALLAAIFYYYGFAKGTALLPSGIAGAVSGAVPLFTLLAAMVLLPEEKPSAGRIGALLVGAVGVLLISRPFAAAGASISLAGVGFIMVGAMSLGVSFVYARRFLSRLALPPEALTTYQLGIATLLLLMVTPLDGMLALRSEPRALAALVLGLGLLGTGIAYLLYYSIVDRLGAVRASTVTYLPPVVALAIGGLLVGEPISALDVMGTGLILAAVILSSRPGRDR